MFFPLLREIKMYPSLSILSFIYERVRRHGDPEAVVTRGQLGGTELSDPNHKRLALCLQQIGDELDNNTQLQRYARAVSLSPDGGSVTPEPFQESKM